MLKNIGNLILRRKWIFIIFWACVFGVIFWKAPNLSELAKNNTQAYLPQNVESAQYTKLFNSLFPDNTDSSTVFISFYRETGLISDDYTYAEQVENYLSDNKEKYKVNYILSPFSNNELESTLISKDKEVGVISVALTCPSFNIKSFDIIRDLKDAISKNNIGADNTNIVPPSGLNINTTGDISLNQEESDTSDKSLGITSLITIILLVIVLILIYRSPIAPLIPLLIIGISFFISRGIIALLAQQGFKISSFTEIFLIAVLFGAGTDYCLLIISRFREGLSIGKSVTDSLSSALPGTAEALITSGGTVIIGFACMIFAKLGLFNSTGPSIAIGVAITILVVLTLTPALLSILGEKLFWPLVPSKKADTENNKVTLWGKISNSVSNKPIKYIVICLVAFVPFLFCIPHLNRSYDQLLELPQNNDSITGFNIMKTHFDQGSMFPIKLVMKTNKDMWSNESLQTLDKLADEILKVDNVAKVKTATRPTGDEITDINVTKQIDLLSNSLGSIKGGFRPLLTEINKLDTGIAQIQSSLINGSKNLKNLSTLSDQLIDSISEIYSHYNINDEFKDLYDSLCKVQLSLGSMRDNQLNGSKNLSSISSSLSKISKLTSQAKAGINKMNRGLGNITNSLKSLSKDDTQLNDTCYIPKGTFDKYPELKQAMQSYIAKTNDGFAMDIILSIEPFSNEALDCVSNIKNIINISLKNTPFENCEFYLGGSPSELNDLRLVTSDDFINIMFFVLLGIFIILALLLRSLIAPIYLLLTILLSFAATMGISYLVFQVLLGYPGINWSMPFFTFCLLVALGVDYNIFLISRVKQEYTPGDTKGAVTRALCSTGGIITSCGIIMAGTFGALIFSPVRYIFEIGLTTVIGILLDTFIIRTLLVPAIAVKLGEFNWWPGKKRT